MTDVIAYAELHCHSYFSLLDGASSPEALVARAQTLSLAGLALTDHDSLAGAVRLWQSARQQGLHAVIGAEVTLTGDRHLTLLAETQAGYANLCQLITASRLDQQGEAWQGKATPILSWERLARHTDGLIALSGCRQGVVAAPLMQGDEAQAQQAAQQLRELFGREHCYIELQNHWLPEDDLVNRQLRQLARHVDLPLVATNNVHYAERWGSRLRDALTAIRHNVSISEARKAGLLPPNSNYGLVSPDEMRRRFAECPEALHRSVAIAGRCQVSLDFSGARLPHFPTPDNLSEFEYLYQLCHTNLPIRYPGLTAPVLQQLVYELDVIDRAGLAGYFLIVWDIVRFARSEGILCQGRGSAANSIVAYLLHITSIDPLRYDLLFERFLSADKFTMPDIDLDFQWDRREEVIQYVYRTYGADCTAMVCNVNCYRARSAIRDLGKTLEFPQAVIDRLTASLDTHEPVEAALQLEAPLMQEPESHPLRQLAELLRQIDGCPRHLSIHSGGMLITGQPLNQVVPLEPATMEGRVVCQWNKESVEDAGLIKIDLLSLRTLGMNAEALRHIAAIGQAASDLNAVPLDDPAIYAMLHRADTIGAFQVESGAQQQMLPRLKPVSFEDLAIEVAIVRPGPIQGGAVHPYLRRRNGQEAVTYAHPSLEPVLKETLGVLLFQEQAIRVAVAAAGFTPGEADLLRRAMSRSRSEEAMAAMQQRFVQGATTRGIEAQQAEVIFSQLEGFAGFGFCKSHAMSFALISYQTLWLKRYYPLAFYCALLNHRPGFYSAEVIINDARRHAVRFLPATIHASQWDYTVEALANGHAIRAGLKDMQGMGEAAWQCIKTERPFVSLADLYQRAGLPKDVLTSLIRGGVLDEMGERRALLWELGTLHDREEGLALDIPPLPVTLPQLSALQRTLWEYELQGHALDKQVMEHYREALRAAGIRSIWEVKQQRPGKRVLTAGMRVMTQRPGTAGGFTFVLIEDESGLLQLAVQPPLYVRFRPLLRHGVLLLVQGLVQREGGTVNLLAGGMWPLNDERG